MTTVQTFASFSACFAAFSGSCDVKAVSRGATSEQTMVGRTSTLGFAALALGLSFNFEPEATGSSAVAALLLDCAERATSDRRGDAGATGGRSTLEGFKTASF